jgi:hypothetical protein
LIQFLHIKSAYSKLQTKSLKNAYNKMHKCTPWSTSFICNVRPGPWSTLAFWSSNYYNLQQAWKQWQLVIVTFLHQCLCIEILKLEIQANCKTTPSWFYAWRSKFKITTTKKSISKINIDINSHKNSNDEWGPSNVVVQRSDDHNFWKKLMWDDQCHDQIMAFNSHLISQKWL